MPSTPETIDDARAIALFLDMMRGEKGAARNTLFAYGADLEGASAALAGRLASADEAALAALLAGWSGVSRATLARRRSALRRFFAFLEGEGVRADNPAAGLAPVASERPLPKVLSEADVAAILEEAARQARDKPGPATLRLRALLELLYGSGLRASELLSLGRNAVRANAPVAIVRGKGGRERMIVITPAAQAAVAEWQAHVPKDSAFLFPSGRGHLSRMALHRSLKAVATAAGIDPKRVSTHVMRHAFATHMLERGADLRALQALLGHADISTTERYTHVATRHLVDMVERHHPLASK